MSGRTDRTPGNVARATGLGHAGVGSLETRTETAFEIRSWDDRSVTRPSDRDRSLEELERDCWPAPSPEATRLITTAHALRRRPVGELTVEDMRLLIGQDIGLPYLLPLAMEVLRENPMAEGHMYEGDLLSAVLASTPSVWAEFPELDRELRGIVSKLTDPPIDLQQKVEHFLVPVPTETRTETADTRTARSRHRRRSR